MSLYNSFDRTRHLDELAEPVETQGMGVLSPAARRRKTLDNLYGTATALDGTVLMPRLASGAASDRLMQVPTVATGGVLDTHTTPTATHSIRIRSDAGTVYYIMVASSSTGRGGA